MLRVESRPDEMPSGARASCPARKAASRAIVSDIFRMTPSLVFDAREMDGIACNAFAAISLLHCTITREPRLEGQVVDDLAGLTGASSDQPAA